MSDPLLAKLSALMGRVAVLQVGGQEDAARDLSLQTARELHDLSDDDVRLVFAGFLGFYAAAVFAGSDEARPHLNAMTAAAVNGGPVALRGCVDAVMSELNPEGTHA